jgi:predicted Zn-dependent protease
MDIDRRRALKQLIVWGAASCCCGCRTTPITGRRQLLLLPEQQEVTMGVAAFDEIAQAEAPSTDARSIELVNRVGQRIAAVAERPDYAWEFRVLASETQNAFCLPGGKVAVYEGILPACANEAGLAVVMSHEISHALARHGGERMSHNYAVEGARQAVQYVTRTQKEENRELVLQAYGVASKYGVVLPYSRKHESEADHMGLMLMAKAGYDPAEAPRFWTRFGSMSQGPETPEFLSTHPSDGRRSEDLAELLPEANQMYAAAATRYGQGEIVQLAARQAVGPQQPSPSNFTVPGQVPTLMPTAGWTRGATQFPGQTAAPAWQTVQ